MRLKNKFVFVIAVYVLAALIPWIWLGSAYGLNNIPHYDLTMWIFMELYALIAGVIGLGITLIALSDGEEEPPKIKRRSNGNHKRKPAAKKKAHVKTSEKSMKPRKPDKKKAEPPENGVEYPAEWDQRDFD